MPFDTSKRFYMTSSPEGSLMQYATAEEAIEIVSQNVKKEGKARYVVEIIARIEPDAPPVKVTRYDE